MIIVAANNAHTSDTDPPWGSVLNREAESENGAETARQETNNT